MLMDSFVLYNHYRIQYAKIEQHDSKSTEMIGKIIKDYPTIRHQEHVLDLIHLIFKHSRHCSVPQCAAQLKQRHLSDLVMSELTAEKINCSLLICLNDMVKNRLLSDTAIDSFVSMVTQFWWDKRIYMCRKSMELCNRMIPLTSKSNEIATSLIQYLHDLSGCLTREIVIQFNQADYTEFAYQPVDSQLTLDRETIKLTVQMIIGLLLKHPEQFPVLLKQLADTVQDIYDDYVTDPMEPIELLFDICCANDDDAIRLLDTVLTIYQEQMHCMYILHQININPHSLFLFFLHRCGSTHDILIDLLIDNSSDFLAYFHRYILYACRDTNQLYASFDDLIIDSDTFQTILANTLRVLGRGGFPYNTRPLMKRLLQLEEQLDPIK